MSWLNEVWNSVQGFKEKYPSPVFDELPVDTLAFAEIDLKLDLIPFPKLVEKYRVEAALMADFSGIYIDDEHFGMIDTVPEWKLSRLRFSIAHELGHWFMHRSLFAEKGFDNFDTFVRWTESLGGRKYGIEREANEFAGRLLVPIEKFKEQFQEFTALLHRFDPYWRNDPELRRRTAQALAPRFGVATQTIETRLSREGLWASPEES